MGIGRCVTVEAGRGLKTLFILLLSLLSSDLRRLPYSM